MKNKEYNVNIGGVNLNMSTGVMAKQAAGSVVVKFGNHVLLCTVSVSESDAPRSFLPLTVNYVEKYYAVGRIPSGFIKRENRPSEREILLSRLIDRSLRPMFVKDCNMEIQVICTVLSYDPTLSVSTAAVTGSAAACAIAGLPMTDIIAGCQVEKVEDELTVGSVSSSDDVELDIFVSGTKECVLMVEAGCQIISEDEVLSGIEMAHSSVKKIIEVIEKMKEECGKPDMVCSVNDTSALKSKVANFGEDKILSAYLDNGTDKIARTKAVSKVKKEIKNHFSEEDSEICVVSLENVISEIEKNVIRDYIIKNQKRIDGRSFDEVRKITIDNDVLPSECVHGASLFTRGETQALVACTLGSAQDKQILDSIGEVGSANFMLHYNFPPFSVGEVSMLRATGRREIGHGKLAFKAIMPVLPKEDFHYTVRLVSEILESNGSSSMATVCGSSLALLSTGIEIKDHVAGVAMGLIKHDKDSIVLTDIMGDEDHLGDMDFKVTGTKDGITALQMDMKIAGISMSMLKQALSQAKEARMGILDIMDESINSPRNLNESVPRFIEITIPKKKIVDLIGKGGSVIKSITEKYECKIDIEDSGTVKIFVNNADKLDDLMNAINDIVAEVVVGNIYPATVFKVMSFGAIVNLPGNKSGLVHISEVAEEHIDNLEDYLKPGQKVEVKILGYDDKKRLKLSIKKAKNS